MFSDDNPRQCERFIEYRKFIELRKGTPILNRKDLLRLKENAGELKNEIFVIVKVTSANVIFTQI